MTTEATTTNITDIIGNRLLTFGPELESGHDSDDGEFSPTREPEGNEKYNLVTSKLPDGKHAVTLDLDYDVKLIESRTEGHHHLYLPSDKSLTWAHYRELLYQLRRMGLIEDGYYLAALDRECTQLRIPKGYEV